MKINLNDLNDQQIDILKEMGNIGAAHAATALSVMISRRIDMKVPKVMIIDFQNLDQFINMDTIVAGIFLQFNGDINGSVLLLLDSKSASNLVSILTGKEHSDTIEFDEFEQSALKEAGNILTGSYLGSLSDLTGFNIITSIPAVAVDMEGAILSVPLTEFGIEGDKAIFIEANFMDGNDKVNGMFLMIPDGESYEKILLRLGIYNNG